MLVQYSYDMNCFRIEGTLNGKPYHEEVPTRFTTRSFPVNRVRKIAFHICPQMETFQYLAKGEN